MNKTTGFIVSIDGPDGSGKTTQITLLKEFLESQGHNVHLTRSSGGTPIGEELRKASHSNHERSAEVDLYISLAMGTALAEDLQARKARGEIVLVDRSPLSIIAYQNFGAQLENQKAGYDAAEKIIRDWQLDLLLVFQISEDELKKRSKIREKTNPDEVTNYFEKRGAEYKQRVQEGYKAGLSFVQKLNLPTRIETIDASRDPQSVQTDIEKIVLSFLT